MYAEGADTSAVRAALQEIRALRATLPIERHATLFGRIETKLGQRLAAYNRGTGYSNRARRARDLFTEHAGRTRIEGAATDKHGNAAGTDYDLGRDGAFAGEVVHVLHLYSGEGFTFRQPESAFTRKGFAVNRRTSPGVAAEFDRWLSDATQLWLISSNHALLTPQHIAVIRAFWERGGALYVWGDNDPYYVDANAVLRALFDGFEMAGNTPGGRVVHELSPDRRGFMGHLVTTGLVHLFEGITVASLDETKARARGFEPLLYGSAGNLITVVRDAADGRGPVMIDTAFTRLYCQWDEAGSARYVVNAACFLGAMATVRAEPDEPEVDGPPDAPRFTREGAFEGTCDLTADAPDTWLVLSVAQLGDALRNTSDMVLTDPLSAGPYNTIFSDQVYGESMGRWIVAQGRDPFTQRPVVETLPLVDLGRGNNLQEFTRQLCVCLMGAKYLPTAAQLVFFAVVDEMLDPSRRAEHPEVWTWLYRQCLTHFRSTPEFTEVGKKVPLLDAMTKLLSPATEERAQLRLSFASTAVVARTLLREKRGAPVLIRQALRRALVKTVVGDAVAAEKAAPGTLHPTLTALLWETWHGIPRLRSGRLVTAWPSFVRDLSRAQPRIERDLDGPLLTADEKTAVLFALLSIDARQYTAESACAQLAADVPAFRAVWKAEGPVDALALLDARFEGYEGTLDEADPHYGSVPPFASTMGPSVFVCVCGHRFGDVHAPLTDEALAAMRTARDEHFRAVYRTSALSSYPAPRTLHYNLHRAVQRVVKEHFADATSFDEAMVPAVAAYLRDDGKGYVCDPLLDRFVRGALASYLARRAAGEAHPEGVLTFERKARAEHAAAQS